MSMRDRMIKEAAAGPSAILERIEKARLRDKMRAERQFDPDVIARRAAYVAERALSIEQKAERARVKAEKREESQRKQAEKRAEIARYRVTVKAHPDDHDEILAYAAALALMRI